jgi:ribonuclease HII
MRAIVQGDSKEASISAASILAKTARDADLYALDKLYPEYGLAKHKGYPTPLHMQMLEQHGVLSIHRKSFGPVKKTLNKGEANE